MAQNPRITLVASSPRDLGSVEIAHVFGPYAPAAPVVAPSAAGGLADVSVTQFSGSSTVNAALDFTNATGGSWSLVTAVTGVSVNSAGLVTINSDVTAVQSGTVIQVRYTNSGGVATSAFQLSVALRAPVASGTLAALTTSQNSGTATRNAAPGFLYATAGTWSLDTSVTGVTINSAGLVSVDTTVAAIQAATSITVRYTNSAGFATSTFALTVTGIVATNALLLFIGGQSNARTASATLANATTQGVTGVTGVKIWKPQNPVTPVAGFQDYSPGVNADISLADTVEGEAWGVEAEFVKRFRVANPSIQVYIVKYAYNGVYIGTTDAGAADPNGWDPTVGGLNTSFDVMESIKTAAKNAMTASNVTIVSEFTIWMQGEKNATTNAGALRYEAEMNTFLAAWQSRISSGRFVLERIRPGIYTAGNFATFADQYIVRKAQEEFAAASPTQILLSNTDTKPAGVATLGGSGGWFTDVHAAGFDSASWLVDRGARAYAHYVNTHTALYGNHVNRNPAPFSFTPQTGVTINSSPSTGVTTITGFSINTPISITGGLYRIVNWDNTEAVSWTSSAGTLHPLQKVEVQVVASGSYSTDTSATLTIGSGVGIQSATFTVTTEAMGAPPNEAETTQFIATADGIKGSTALTTPQITALNTFYSTHRGKSWWSKIRRLYVRFGSEPASSYVDLKSQTVVATAASTVLPTLASSGWTTGGANGQGIDLKFNATTDVPSNTDIGIFFWSDDLGAADPVTGNFFLQSAIGTTADLSLRHRVTSDGITQQGRINASANQVVTLAGGAATAAITPGLVLANRTGSLAADCKFYTGGVLRGSPTGGTLQAVTSTKLCLFASTSTALTPGRKVKAAGAGQAFTSDAEVTDFDAALTILVNALA